jgi:RNA polymerase sigma factor (sigma-70 family)
MAAGDAGAIEAFYRRYFDFLYAQARRATGRDESFCLDVVQEAVLRIIRNVRGVQSEAQLAAWLRLVVKTTALDQLKSERRRHERQLVVAAAAGPRDSAGDDDAAERIEQLKAEISRLDPELARLIELRFARRWTLGRIAEALGLSVGTIDGRLRRALIRLREKLEESERA